MELPTRESAWKGTIKGEKQCKASKCKCENVIKIKVIMQMLRFIPCTLICPKGKIRQVTFKCEWSLERSQRPPLTSCRSSLSRLIDESCDAFLSVFLLTLLIFPPGTFFGLMFI